MCTKKRSLPFNKRLKATSKRLFRNLTFKERHFEILRKNKMSIKLHMTKGTWFIWPTKLTGRQPNRALKRLKHYINKVKNRTRFFRHHYKKQNRWT